MGNSFKEHRKIHTVVTYSGETKSISIPKLILRDLEKAYDLTTTYFHIQFKQEQLVFTSGCIPSGGTINGQR